MVLSLFLPTYKKNTLLLSQSVVTFSCENAQLVASKVVVSGSKATLKKIKTCELPTDQEALKATLQTMLTEFNGYDQLVSVHTSESILFKEIELPLTTREHVSLVLEEEIEPHLPFSPLDGNTGFIINRSDTEGVCAVLTATIKKQSADTFYAPFETAEVFPDAITTDIECLAALIAATHFQQDATAHFLKIIVDIHPQHTQLIFMQDGNIRTAKTIPAGSQTFITLNPGNAEEKTAPTQSFDEKKYAELIEKILFASDAIALKYLQSAAEQTLFFMQTYQEYDLKNHILEFFSPATVASSGLFDGLPTEPTDWNALSKHLGNALLMQREEKILLPIAITNHNILHRVKKNVTTALLILTLIAGSIFLLGYQQISTLSSVLGVAESTQLSKLNEKFSPQLAMLNKPSLKRAIAHIEEHVREQQIFWNMFGAKNLNSLEIMYELTELIDRRVFNVDVTHVNISLSEDDHTPRITLEGTFTSKTEAHYSDFGIFEKHLALSKRLMLTKDTENSFADNAHGVKFAARFKLRDT